MAYYVSLNHRIVKLLLGRFVGPWLLAIVPLFLSLAYGQGGYSFIEATPGQTANYWMICLDGIGNPLINCQVDLYGPAAYENSGGHLHNADRPNSVFSPTSGYYEYPDRFWFQIDTTHNVGQWEWFYNCVWGSCEIWDLWVRHWPLWEVTDNTSYRHLIGDTQWHPYNHFGTDFLVQRVDQVLQQYYGEFYCVTSQQGIWGYQAVGLNDMSLEGGGIFDIKQHLGAQWRWNPPHSNHSAGNSADFRCKPQQYWSIIYVDPAVERFMEICDEKGLEFQLREDQGTSNEHVHCGKWNGN